MQGVYWVLTGLWALVHYRSFVSVTGPKVDDWLVKTISGLITAIGAVLLLGASRGRATSMEVTALGLGGGVSLVTADVVFAARGRISKVYLLDALAHLVIFALWARDLLAPRRTAEG